MRKIKVERIIEDQTVKKGRGSRRRSTRVIVKREPSPIPFFFDYAKIDIGIASLQNPYFKKRCPVLCCRYIEFFSDEGLREHMESHYDERIIKKNSTCKRCKVYISSRHKFNIHRKSCKVPFPDVKESDSDESDAEEEPKPSELSIRFTRRRRRLQNAELAEKRRSFRDDQLPLLQKTVEEIKNSIQTLTELGNTKVEKVTGNSKIYNELLQKLIFPNRVAIKQEVVGGTCYIDIKPSIFQFTPAVENFFLQYERPELFRVKVEPPDHVIPKEEPEEATIMDLNERDIKPSVFTSIVKAEGSQNCTNNPEEVIMDLKPDIKPPILSIIGAAEDSSRDMKNICDIKPPIIQKIDTTEDECYSRNNRSKNKRGRPNKRDSTSVAHFEQHYTVKVEPVVKMEPEDKKVPARKRNRKTVSESSKRRNEGKVFNCEICTYATKEQGNFKRHFSIHVKKEDNIKKEIQPQKAPRVRKSEKPLVQCKHCEFSSRETGNFSRHMSTHGIPERNSVRYQCKMCDFSAKGYNEMNFHTLRQHEVYSMHECDFCDKEFVSSVQLKAHRYEHADPVPKNKLPAETSRSRSRRTR